MKIVNFEGSCALTLGDKELFSFDSSCDWPGEVYSGTEWDGETYLETSGYATYPLWAL